MNTAHGQIIKGDLAVEGAVGTSAWPEARDVRDLERIARAALKGFKPPYVRPIFGEFQSWAPPYRQFSEYNIIDLWRPVATLRFLADLTVPAQAKTTPDGARFWLPSLFTRRIWRPTHFFRQPDEYGGFSSFPDEHWFFINGIGTNADVARINAAFLAHLFHRPLTVVQNATNSLLVDLHECAIGKGFKKEPKSDDRKTMTEPAWRATAALLQALNAKHVERVVVIAHSQGTIITSNVLRAVAHAFQSGVVREGYPGWHDFAKGMMGEVTSDTQKISRDNIAHSMSELSSEGRTEALRRMAKLEIYTFANCADDMRYVAPPDPIPYMEHFANERDLVAWLGILSPLRGESDALIEIDGPMRVRAGAWGHLLNEHYLAPIDDYLYPSPHRPPRESDPYPATGHGPTRSRLYDYFHGKRPEDLPTQS